MQFSAYKWPSKYSTLTITWPLKPNLPGIYPFSGADSSGSPTFIETKVYAGHLCNSFLLGLGRNLFRRPNTKTFLFVGWFPFPHSSVKLVSVYHCLVYICMFVLYICITDCFFHFKPFHHFCITFIICVREESFWACLVRSSMLSLFPNCIVRFTYSFVDISYKSCLTENRLLKEFFFILYLVIVLLQW